MKMGKEHRFCVLVQTALVAQGPAAWELAVRVLDDAMDIPPEFLPDDVASAAIAYMNYRVNGLGEPPWHVLYASVIRQLQASAGRDA